MDGKDEMTRRQATENVKGEAAAATHTVYWSTHVLFLRVIVVFIVIIIPSSSSSCGRQQRK